MGKYGTVLVELYEYNPNFILQKTKPPKGTGTGVVEARRTGGEEDVLIPCIVRTCVVQYERASSPSASATSLSHSTSASRPHRPARRIADKVSSFAQASSSPHRHAASGWAPLLASSFVVILGPLSPRRQRGVAAHLTQRRRGAASALVAAPPQRRESRALVLAASFRRPRQR